MQKMRSYAIYANSMHRCTVLWKIITLANLHEFFRLRSGFHWLVNINANISTKSFCVKSRECPKCAKFSTLYFVLNKIMFAPYFCLPQTFQQREPWGPSMDPLLAMTMGCYLGFRINYIFITASNRKVWLHW